MSTITLEVNEQDVKTLLAALRIFGEDWIRYIETGHSDRYDWPRSAVSLSAQIIAQARMHNIPVD
jgi:hypothetical protein